jgi:hypothetical protein
LKKRSCPSRSEVSRSGGTGRLAAFVALVLHVAGMSGNSALAAPCCAASSAIPSLITGDDFAQVSASLSQGTVIGDAPAEGIPVFRSGSDSESTQVLRLEGAYLVMDRLQVSGGLPLVRRARESARGSSASSGVGDLSLGTAYELLPEWTYSSWRPRGFVFLQAVAPLGPSIHEASDAYLLDARGRGFFSLALGAAFVKTLGDWDATASLEAHRSLPKTVSRAGGSSELRLSPGWGGSALVALGFSPGGGALRLGASLSPVFEGAVVSSGETAARSEPQLVWNTGLQATYLLSPSWSAGASYVDQTLAGPARNSSLSRTLSLTAQRRWEL